MTSEKTIDNLAKIVKDLEDRIMLLECRWGSPPSASHFIIENKDEQTTGSKSGRKRKAKKAAKKTKRKV